VRLILLTVLLSVFPWLEGRASLEIRVCSTLPTLDTPQVTFTVVNRASEAVELYFASLPWIESSPLKLKAFADAGNRSRVLKQVRVIHDAPFRLVTIGPGESLSGTIDLENHFPNIRRELRSHDVLLLWEFYMSGPAIRTDTYRGVVSVSQPHGQGAISRAACSCVM
jgi:hypothetical protein